MCAGVQNVSRPIERCQAISQCVPTIAEVTAATAHQTYQGMGDGRVSRIGSGNLQYYPIVGGMGEMELGLV